MLVSAVQGDWAQPARYDADESSQIWALWMTETTSEEPIDGTDVSGSEESVEAGTFLLEENVPDTREIWAQVLEELRMQMTRATFDTWLHGSRVVGVENGEMIVRVRDSYAVDWLHARWLTPIQRTVAGIVGHSVPIRFEAA